MGGTFGDVEIEEVAVEHRLHHAGHDGDQVEEAVEVVAVRRGGTASEVQHQQGRYGNSPT